MHKQIFNMFKISRNKRGQSLIEMIVVIAIFSVTMLAATDIFKWVIQGQKNALAAQTVQENIRYAFETMSKEIRMAQESDTGCLGSGIYKVYNTSASNSRLYFRNQNGDCVTYYLSGNAIMVTRAGTSAAITPDEITVSNLNFSVADDLISALHTNQPRVTMTMDVGAVGKVLHQQNMKLQFTISSRYYQ